MTLTRRRLIAGGSTAAVLSLAGCLAESGVPGSEGNDDADDDGDDADDDANGGDDADTGGDDDGNGSDEESESDGETDDSDDADGYELVDYETLSYDGDGETDGEALFSAEEVEEAVDLEERSGETASDIETFVEETDFDDSVVLSLRTTGPNLCYAFELEDVDVDEDGLSVRAAAVDESGPDEACADAIANLAMLVRVTFEDAVPRDGSITIVDGWGAEHGIAYATDSATDEVGAGSGTDGNETDTAGDETDTTGGGADDCDCRNRR